MSILFADGGLPARAPRSATAVIHQRNSWSVLIGRWLARIDRMHQRDDLRAIADNPHLLADLGLTRDEALGQANKPFWR